MKVLNKIWSASLLAFMLMMAAAFESLAQNRGGDTSLVFKKPDQNSALQKQEALKQKAEQVEGEQKAVRQQRRQQRIRQWQESTVSAPIQPPPIWGKTPLQQQQMAVRDRKRQLQREQQVQRAQQLKFEKTKVKP